MFIDFATLKEGDIFSQEYTISEDVYKNFLAAFNDQSRVHVDESYAKANGFAGRVMHGNILNGFVSHFVGMICPGDNALLHSVNIQYKNPSYLDDVIVLNVKIEQIVESVRVLMLEIEIQNTTQNTLVGIAQVQTGVRE